MQEGCGGGKVGASGGGRNAESDDRPGDGGRAQVGTLIDFADHPCAGGGGEHSSVSRVRELLEHRRELLQRVQSLLTLISIRANPAAANVTAGARARAAGLQGGSEEAVGQRLEAGSVEARLREAEGSVRRLRELLLQAQDLLRRARVEQ